MNNVVVNRSVQPHVGSLHGMKLPQVRRMMLDNGVRLVWLDHGQQPVNRMMITWSVGLADVESQEALRLLRMSLQEGTSSFSGEQMAEAFEFNGAWIKIEAGMHSLSLTVHSLNKTIDKILPLIMEMITVPLFPEENVRHVVEKEAASCDLRRQRVAQKASELSRRLFYGEDHRMAHVETGDTIRGVERRLIVELHERIMLSAPPAVYLAGQVDASLLSAVTAMSGSTGFSHRADGVRQQIVPCRYDAAGCRAVDQDDSSMQTAVRLVLPTIGRDDRDYEALRFAVFALGGYFGSRLMSNIREDKGYTYGINASLASLKEGAYIGITCQCDNKYAGAVMAEIENEIARMASEPMDGAELEVVKSSVMSGLASVLDSPFSIMDYHFMLDSFGLSGDYYGYQLAQLEALTPERIMECAVKYMAVAPRLMALSGNPLL